MRYLLYGSPTIQHHDDNSDLDPSLQRVSETRQVYATDSMDEAQKILKEGGYIDSHGTWFTVQWMQDSLTGGVKGDKPPTSEAYQTTPKKALRKSDFT